MVVELPLTFKVNVDVVIDELSIGSLNVPRGHTLTAAFVAPLAGLVLVTLGGVPSDAVVKDQA